MAAVRQCLLASSCCRIKSHGGVRLLVNGNAAKGRVLVAAGIELFFEKLLVVVRGGSDCIDGMVKEMSLAITFHSTSHQP